MTRQLLYNKDIQALTGKSERACYRLIRKIQATTGKNPEIPLTIEEFCNYMHLRVEAVQQILTR